MGAHGIDALQLESLESELLDAIAKRADLGALEEVRIAALGKKGRVSELMQALGRAAAGGAQELSARRSTA